MRFDPDFTDEDAERESLDNSDPTLIGSRCICGRWVTWNPFGGKTRCPTCGAEVGPL